MTRKERIERAIARANEEHEAAYATKLLRQRMAYHRAKIAEDRAAAEARDAQRRRMKRLFSLGLLGH